MEDLQTEREIEWRSGEIRDFMIRDKYRISCLFLLSFPQTHFISQRISEITHIVGFRGGEYSEQLVDGLKTSYIWRSSSP